MCLCFLRLVGTKVLPALGMAWANQVLVRLMLRRLAGRSETGDSSGDPRKLEVVFAPHLPQAFCLCSVREEGVKGIPPTDPSPPQHLALGVQWRNTKRLPGELWALYSATHIITFLYYSGNRARLMTSNPESKSLTKTQTHLWSFSYCWMKMLPVWERNHISLPWPGMIL